MFAEVSQRPVESDKSTVDLPPFLVNVLTAMASELGGRADLKASAVYTDCGHISLGMGEEGTIWVHGLYIDSDRQREGCGQKKLKALEEAVARLSTSTMNIKLWPVRSAIGFYMKSGFSLRVDTSPSEKYYLARDKAYGSKLDQYTAKVRVQVEEAADGKPWDHKVLWPLYEKSDLFDADEPMFYSLWIADVARGDYEHAIKVVQPSRGNIMSRGV